MAEGHRIAGAPSEPGVIPHLPRPAAGRAQEGPRDGVELSGHRADLEDSEAEGLRRRSFDTEFTRRVYLGSLEERRALIPELRAAARAGNRKALELLRSLLTIGDVDTRPEAEALRALGDAGEHLSEKDVQWLSGLADRLRYSRPEAAAAAREALGRAAATGSREALERLRSGARQERFPEESLDLLAQAENRLEADDFQLILERGRRGSNASQTLARKATEGHRPALDGLGQTLTDYQGDPDQKALLQRRAVESMDLALEHLGERDARALLAAAQGEDAGLASDSLKLLTRMATSDPPRPGGVEALDQALTYHREHRQGGEGAWASQGAAKELDAWFARTADPGTADRLAHQVLDFGSQETRSDAVTALRRRALEGDPQALGALGRDFNKSHSKEDVDLASGLLTEAAARGHAGALDALRQGLVEGTTERQRAALEGLERSAPHLREAELEALGQIFRQSGSSDEERRRAAGVLGKVAAGESPAAERARRELREGAAWEAQNRPRDRRLAAEAMKSYARDFEAPDVELLTRHLSPEAAGTLAEAAAHLGDEDREALLDQLRPHLRGDLRDPALRALEPVADRLRESDTAILRDLSREQDWRGRERLRSVLGKVLDQNPGQVQQTHAAEALLRLGARPGDERWDTIVGRIADGDDAELKKMALDRLPRSPLSAESAERVARKLQEKLVEAIREAPEGSDLETLGKLYEAESWAYDSEHEYHERAKRDLDLVKGKIENLLQKPEMQQRLADMRQEALREVFGDRGPEKAQADYLTSPEFRQRLSLLADDEAEKVAKTEMEKLGQLDPALAQETGKKLLTLQMDDLARERMAGLSDPESEKYFEQALQQAMERDPELRAEIEALQQELEGLDVIGAPQAGLGATKGSRTAARVLVAAFRAATRRETAGHALARESDAIMARLPESVKARIARLEKRGTLGAVGALASLASLGVDGLPKDAWGGLAAGSNLAGLLGESDNLARVAARLRVISPGTLRAVNASRLLKFARWAGPVGAVVGGVVDARATYEEFSEGDIGGGVGKGLVGAGAAIIFLAPGWGLLALGAGLAIDALFGEDREETLMRQLELP